MKNVKILVSTVSTALLAIAFGGGSCVPPAGNTSCEKETDCGAEEHCHPSLFLCVPNCNKVTDACTAADTTGPTCAATDADVSATTLHFSGICVCDPASDTCSGGDKCNPYDHACDTPCTAATDCSSYPADQKRECRTADGSATGTKFCLLPATDCRTNTAANNGCESTKVCDTTAGAATAGTCIDKCTANSCNAATQYCETTGLCVARCTAGTCGDGKYCDSDLFENSGKCLASPASCTTLSSCLEADVAGICDPDNGNETYNMCADPDSVTNTCAAGTVLGNRDDAGPVVYDVEFTREADMDASCPTSGDTAYGIFLFYYDFEGDSYTGGTGSYANGFKWAREGGSALSATLPLGATAGNTGTLGSMLMYVCFTSAPTTVAVQAFDTNSHQSNAVCATLQ